MRFAAANSFSAADYASAGRAASNSLVNSFAAARRNAPDWTGLARTSMNTRSQERQTAMKAEADVATAGMRAFGNVKDVQIKGAYEHAALKTKLKSQKSRMAGKLGALGGFKMPKPSNKKHYDNFINKLEGMKQQVPDGQGGFVDNTQAAAAPELVTKEQVLAEQAANTPAPTQQQGQKQQPPTNPSSPAAVTAPTSKPTSDGNVNTGVRLMNNLVSKGYSPISAAAITGNAAHESANFTAHEEFAPNSYGTKGVGFFQWTNAGGGMRRTEFENYAKAQGLDPKSFEASAGYIDTEMRGGAHWTGGMNLQKFQGINNLQDAVINLQNNYLRPAQATAGTQKRLNYANQYLSQYNAQFS